ncbi:MAG: hypothetical protein M3R04_09905, partial [bacterium]|nr:hypothetical protein [bacterium]
MSIRCLFIAAFAVGIWGGSWAFAEDNSADSDAAEAAVRAEEARIKIEPEAGDAGGAPADAGADAESVSATEVQQDAAEVTALKPALDTNAIAESCAQACGRAT